MGFGRYVSSGTHKTGGRLGLALACLLLAAAPACGADGASPDYPAYLAQHQADLEPFFSAHGTEMFKQGLHILIGTMGNILLVTALVGWAFDVGLVWGYATIFAPAYAKFPRALIYASGRLVLALMLTIALTFVAMLGVNAGAGLPALTVVAVLTVPAMFVQVYWVGHLYRTSAKPSLLFYTALLAMHALIFAVLVPTVFAGQVALASAKFQDECVIPALRAEADATRHDADTLMQARDSAHTQVDALSARLAQDQAQEADLQKQIEAGKDSPALQYGRLVLLRAQGNLADAGTGLAAFIAHYPKDPHADAARGQLVAVNHALSAQLALQAQQEAQNAQAAAVARRALLADADAGRATLSELRGALLGQTTAQVAALFGKPSETGADKWGYGRRMVIDPQSGEHRGLTVIFSEGIVQGVDYYYGEAQ
jgi:hypothetical protein